MIRPRTLAPPLRVDTLDEPRWALDRQSPERFTMIAFYRGMHSDACRGHLEEMTRLRDRFTALGVDPIAMSGDDRRTAERTREAWEIDGLRLGYDVDEVTMRSWELFISRAITPDEPATFCEPGLFLVDGDQRLFCCAITSMPFGRPDLESFVGGLERTVQQEEPARGDD